MSHRCNCLTSTGKRCSRSVKTNEFCWQHKSCKAVSNPKQNKKVVTPKKETKVPLKKEAVKAPKVLAKKETVKVASKVPIITESQKQIYDEYWNKTFFIYITNALGYQVKFSIGGGGVISVSIPGNGCKIAPGEKLCKTFVEALEDILVTPKAIKALEKFLVDRDINKWNRMDGGDFNPKTGAFKILKTK